MYQQETIKPYNNGDKATQVEQMFDNIAPTYDALNHRLSWDIDRSWRKKAIKQLAPYRPQAILPLKRKTVCTYPTQTVLSTPSLLPLASAISQALTKDFGKCAEC